MRAIPAADKSTTDESSITHPIRTASSPVLNLQSFMVISVSTSPSNGAWTIQCSVDAPQLSSKPPVTRRQEFRGHKRSLNRRKQREQRKSERRPSFASFLLFKSLGFLQQNLSSVDVNHRSRANWRDDQPRFSVSTFTDGGQSNAGPVLGHCFRDNPRGDHVHRSCLHLKGGAAHSSRPRSQQKGDGLRFFSVRLGVCTV